MKSKLSICILALFVFSNVLDGQILPLYKRALDPTIDLNRTPSPEQSLNEPSTHTFVEDTATTERTQTAKVLKRKRKIYPTKHQKIKQAYNDRFEMHPNDEEKRKSIEESWKKSLEERKIIHNRSKKRMWERIKAGKATEADLRAKERSQLATIVWRKAHPEKMKEYQRNRQAMKKKRKLS